MILLKKVGNNNVKGLISLLMQKGESLKASLIEEVFTTSNWFNRLKEYFPEREMKSKQHFELLFQEKQATYQLMEGPDFIVVYFEQQDYIFIDYILVTGGRGKGVGTKVLNEMKSKGKAIILEVEPISPLDPDSEKRIRFYQRHDFFKMEKIKYERIHMVTNELNVMDVYCWSPVSVAEEWVLDQMKEIYTEVHAFKANEIYGKDSQSVSEVLSLKEILEAAIQ